MYPQKLRNSIILIFFAAISAWPRISIALFPLNDKSGNQMNEWVSYAVPDLLFRSLSMLEGVQVWDPIFLFNADSVGWEMESDSLLQLHRQQWEWNIVAGGRYRVSGDTVALEFLFIDDGEERWDKKKITVRGNIRTFSYLCDKILKRFVEDIGLPASENAASYLKDSHASRNYQAYATYAAGYGFELTGEYPAALSAYYRAIDIDPSFSIARYRAARIHLLADNHVKALELLQNSGFTSSFDPLAKAWAAEFYIDNETPEKALGFTDKNRSVLEKTACGLKALGKAHLLEGAYDRAEAMLTRASAFGPSDLETEFLLATVFLSTGRFTRASEIFNHLIELQPRNMKYYSHLGGAFRRAGKLMESVQVLENALNIEPDNPSILISLAQTYSHLEWYEKAEQLLLHALEINPDLDVIHLNLGVLYWHLGKKEKAEKIFTQSTKSVKNTQLALNNRGNIHFLKGEIKKAIKCYRKADKAGKKSDIILSNMASAYLAVGNKKDAFACLEELIRLSPVNIDALDQLARIAEEQEKYKKAEEYYLEILQAMPHSEDAVTGLVGIYRKQERYDDAVAVVESYLNRYPGDKRLRLLLADIYSQRGWYEVAVAKYEEMIRDFPDDPQIKLRFGKSIYDGITYRENSNHDRAVYVLKSAAAGLPGNPEPDYLIGMIYMDKKYKALAVEHWNNALSKATDRRLIARIQDLIAKAQR
ncbi:MAG: tetratricopeptide repeat protein [Chitinivibrionales bacterium]|nr:tetratricopeptide repeat protein [Chitinivibrionales bacterium]